MTDPHEIIEEALANAHDLDMTDALYAKAIVRKLEAAGFRIVSTRVGVASPEMIDAIEQYPGKGNSSFPDHYAEDVVRAFLSRAPLFGKGSEK